MQEPSAPTAPPAPLFDEPVGANRRAWVWLPVIVVVTFFAAAPVIAPIASLAWLYNVLRFRRTRVRVDADYLWVGKRWVRLCALELSTLGQAGNTWPWRSFNKRYLGANPIWTRDSVGLRGIDVGRRYWVAIGTNRRDDLVAVLTSAVPTARERAEAAGTWAPDLRVLPPAGWHPDPWNPAGQLRWWDGRAWTGWTWPPTPAPTADDPVTPS